MENTNRQYAVDLQESAELADYVATMEHRAQFARDVVEAITRADSFARLDCAIRATRVA